jgi:hypothetical protein
MKRCSKCRQEKSLDHFNKHAKHGYQSYCRECNTAAKMAWRHANPEKHRVSVKRHFEKFKTRIMSLRRGGRAGLTPLQIETLLTSQGGKCAVCGTTDPGLIGWQLDHDHLFQKVRGLLCTTCNCGLGFFKDDSKLLQQAICYLTKPYYEV